MSAVDDIYIVRTEGERLDKIAKARLGTEQGGTVEAILDLNPGLAQLGTILPLGTRIKLPPKPPAGGKPRIVPRIWG